MHNSVTALTLSSSPFTKTKSQQLNHFTVFKYCSALEISEIVRTFFIRWYKLLCNKSQVKFIKAILMIEAAVIVRPTRQCMSLLHLLTLLVTLVSSWLKIFIFLNTSHLIPNHASSIFVIYGVPLFEIFGSFSTASTIVTSPIHSKMLLHLSPAQSSCFSNQSSPTCS